MNFLGRFVFVFDEMHLCQSVEEFLQAFFHLSRKEDKAQQKDRQEDVEEKAYKYNNWKPFNFRKEEISKDEKQYNRQRDSEEHEEV